MSRFIFAAGALALTLTAPAALAGDPDGDRPPHAVPGQCYEKVRTAEVYETVPERRMVEPERIERRLIPAEWGWRDRTVVVRPARVERYPVPPVFRTVTETVVVHPPTFRREVIPPVFETVTRQVLVREARTVWKPGYAQPAYGGGYGHPAYAPQGYGPGWHGQTQVTPTGEVMCLVVEPALYRTVVEQVMRVPERVIDHPVPAVTRLEHRQVVERAGYEATREIPAEYGTVREKYIVRPEREDSFTIPPVYTHVPVRRLVTPARTDWRPIACAVPPAPPPPPPCVSPCGPPPPPMARPYVRRWSHGPVAKPRPRVHRRHYARPAPACAPCAAAPMHHPHHGERMAPPPVAHEHGEGAPPAGRDMVARMQRSLAERGYYKGPVDGVNTTSTNAALRAYQRDNRLASDGRLTRETARGLGLER